MFVDVSREGTVGSVVYGQMFWICFLFSSRRSNADQGRGGGQTNSNGFLVKTENRQKKNYINRNRSSVVSIPDKRILTTFPLIA